MNIGEVRKAKTHAKDMIGFQAKVAAASTEEQQDAIAQESLNRSDEADLYLFSVFKRCLAMTEDQFNSLKYPQAGVIFDKLLGESIPKKNSEKPSA